MKFSEIEYVRPDIDSIRAETDRQIAKFKNASSAAEQIDVIFEHEASSKKYSTMATVASIRNSIDTRDEFYEKEIEYIDENSPLIEEKEQEFLSAVFESKFRPELEARFGKLMFKKIEIAKRSFDPKIIPLMQEENKLTSAYQKLYGSAIIDFDGKKLPLPMLGPYGESPDREVRRAACEATGKFFDEHQKEFDELYDKLVKNRDAQAKALGYKNYVYLGYDRLGRNCYGPEQVEKVREQIANDAVPVVCEVKELQRKRIGVDKLKLYDNGFLFADGNAKPEGTAEEILAAGKKMYHELSPETKEFIDLMYDNGLLDVLSKEGKAPGGYCTYLAEYKYPFIFSNFNGTSGDVDVLTHEAGHAFAAYRASKNIELSILADPTMESCECHSMSMEFLTADYHELFFGKSTKKYELYHAEDSFCFIPYGCMVDEFQTRMYENPDYTPDERNEVWLNLEKKYRPFLDLAGIPFYERGAGWERQLHIYMYPLYCIDYCMAQTIAFQFWLLSLENKKEAWEKYLAFVDLGGTKDFEGLVESAGLDLPYSDGAIKRIADKVGDWIKTHQL